ncbi:hypothetical protein HBB16_20730 [Pseudonocardia sp. MCCB 268]|nr:hypothetical protein [Pseudonocardia cytotoxica]
MLLMAWEVSGRDELGADRLSVDDRVAARKGTTAFLTTRAADSFYVAAGRCWSAARRR